MISFKTYVEMFLPLIKLAHIENIESKCGAYKG